MPSTASEMLNDLKSRLGFSRNDDAYDDGDFDAYDDFDDGFNEQDDREYAGYGADYDESAPVGSYRPATTRSNRFGRVGSMPDLVSLDDVKAHTRDPYAGSGSTTTRSVGGRDLIDDRAPATSSPAYNASLRERERQERQAASRSDGLNSLFEPSAGAASGTDISATRTSSRKLVVVRPASYADAERVTRALKSGDVAVLAMRSTPRDLFQRVLDFAFGAASALDASVDSPAEKVFVVARGAGLSDSETRQLRSQGVL